jgi:hypothetical protein
MMKPTSSAMPMNSDGGNSPLSRWRQRNSASKPQVRSERMSTIG